MSGGSARRLFRGRSAGGGSRVSFGSGFSVGSSASSVLGGSVRSRGTWRFRLFESFWGAGCCFSASVGLGTPGTLAAGE